MISLADGLADLEDKTKQEMQRATILLHMAETLNSFKAVSPSHDRYYKKVKPRYERWVEDYLKR